MTLEKTKTLSANTEIVYQVVSPPVPFVSDRDMYMLCSWKCLGEGNYQILMFSIPNAPEVAKKVRADTFIAWTIADSDAGKCFGIGYSSINPNGSIPGMLANKMSKAAGKSAQQDKKNIEAGILYDGTNGAKK